MNYIGLGLQRLPQPVLICDAIYCARGRVECHRKAAGMEFLDLNLLPQVVSGVDAGEVPVRSAANNGAATRGWRRQGRKKPVGVRKEDVEDLDTAIREGLHA